MALSRETCNLFMPNVNMRLHLATCPVFFLQILHYRCHSRWNHWLSAKFQNIRANVDVVLQNMSPRVLILRTCAEFCKDGGRSYEESQKSRMRYRWSCRSGGTLKNKCYTCKDRSRYSRKRASRSNRRRPPKYPDGGLPAARLARSLPSWVSKFWKFHTQNKILLGITQLLN